MHECNLCGRFSCAQSSFLLLSAGRLAAGVRWAVKLVMFIVVFNVTVHTCFLINWTLFFSSYAEYFASAWKMYYFLYLKISVSIDMHICRTKICWDNSDKDLWCECLLHGTTCESQYDVEVALPREFSSPKITPVDRGPSPPELASADSNKPIAQ
jgi:hypothetical protein